MAQPSESSHERALRLWSPVLGYRYAELRAVALRSTLRGYLGALLIVPIVVIIPFVFRDLLVGVAIEVVLLVVSVSWLALGLLPMYRVANSFATELRNAGIAMNHVPALNSVEMFDRWLAKNDLSGDQVAAICDRPPRLTKDS